MSKTTTYLLKRAIFLMAPFLFISCEKDNGTIGLNQVINGLADLNDTTLPLVSYTTEVDSILVALDYKTQSALGGYVGNRLLGVRVDPAFGQAKASLVSQALLAQVNPDFGSNPVVDSVRLHLRYNGFYGDTTVPMSLSVYEITEALNRDTSYYSSFEPALGAKIGGKDNFLPRPHTNVYLNEVFTNPTLSIPMDAAFFQQKIADVADGSFESLSSNEEFVEYFNGIYITPSSEQGSILYISMVSTNSRIVMYYHNDTDTNSLVMNFPQTSTTRPINFNTFQQNYTAYPTAFNLANPDSTAPGAATTYVQSMGGVATVIKLSELKELLEDKDIVVNRAFLELPAKRGLVSTLPPPSSMELRRMKDGQPSVLIKDFRFQQTSGDGKLRLGYLRDNKYIFEITQHIFEVLDEEENPELMVVPVNKATSATQVALSGGNDPLKDVVLRVYYSKP